MLTGPQATVLLRKAYRDHLLLLAGCDLAATVEDEPVLAYVEVVAHLSELAGAALTAALAVAVAEVSPDAPVAARLAVVAMGKCGARELNYVSDVDVVFVAEPADQATSKLAGRVMQVAGEACFEVDANLRPEGRQGALVRTLDGHVSYYKRWAKTWEFQALLKARPIAGDPELGKAYAEAVAPMVWNAVGRDGRLYEMHGAILFANDGDEPVKKRIALRIAFWAIDPFRGGGAVWLHGARGVKFSHVIRSRKSRVVRIKALAEVLLG